MKDTTDLNLEQIKLFTREHIQNTCYNVDIEPQWLDENRFVYVYQTPMGDQHIEVNCQTGQTTTLPHNPIQTPPNKPDKRISPDGQFEITLQNYNLYLGQTDSAQKTQLTHDGTADQAYATMPGTCRLPLQIESGDLPWALPGHFSPDGRYFLTYQLDERDVQYFHITRHQTETGRPEHHQYHHPYVGDPVVPYHRLVLIDLQQRTSRKLQADKIYLEFFSLFDLKNWIWWSDNSATIYYVQYHRGYKQLDLCQYDITTDQERVLLSEHSDTYIEVNPVFFWDNNIRVLEDSNEILWWSERDNHGHLYLYDKPTGQLKGQITQGDWVVLDVLSIDQTNRKIYFTGCGKEAGDPYYRYLYVVDFEGKNLRCLTPERAEHRIFPSPNMKYFVDSYSTIRTAPITELRDNQGKLIQQLATANISALTDNHWQPPESISLTALDGKTILYGEIFKPSYFTPDQTYPVIDHIYPGPQNIHTPKSFCANGNGLAYRWPGMWHMQALAECGFIVIAIDTPGSSMRSRAFREASYGKMHSTPFAEHKAALEKIAADRSYMDLKRVGITGHSAGGYATVRAMLTYPDFYKVGVSGSGVHDLKNFMAYWSEKYQGMIDTGHYQNAANQDFADQLQGKLLLIHGEIDDNVHIHHTLNLYDALLNAGKRDQVELMVLLNCYHECDEHPDYLAKRWRFFKDNL